MDMTYIDGRPAAGIAGHVENVLDRLGRFPASARLLLARVAVGAVFWKSGMTKIASWPQTLALFEDEYQVPLLPPDLAAWLATSAELTAPVLLVVGIAARLGALALLGMTAVIQVFVYPHAWAEHLLWATLLAMILTEGPGRLSIDHLVRRVAFGDGAR
ncbi:MAG: DoxX family protein [Alphaproteobacteria bacterium]